MNTTDNTHHRDQSRYLITAPDAAELVSSALAEDRTDTAVRWLTEAVARLIESRGVDIPDDMFEEPATTGDRKYDAVLATAFLYASNLCGVEAAAWMQAERLDEEWLWGGDGYESVAYRAFIRRETPAEFLERNVLCRPRDWVNA